MSNKSLVSNLIAAVLVLFGLLLSGPWQVVVLNTGLFALSGGITNWLAVHMLFERVPGLYGSGVIQLRFEEFKTAIRDLIMEQFFAHADLEAYFHDLSDHGERIREGLEKVIDDIDLDGAFDSLLEVIMASSFAGMLKMVGGRDALTSLKTPFVERMRDYIKNEFSNRDLEQQLQTVLRQALNEESIRNRLEFLIDQRLDQLTPGMVKDIVQNIIREHLGWLVVWGCAFGGLIGLVVGVSSLL